MKLTELQRQIVETIGDKTYTVEFLERYWNEKPEETAKLNYSLAVLRIKQAAAFMAAVQGIEKVITAREAGRTSERTEGDGYISERGKFPRRALPKGKKRGK